MTPAQIVQIFAIAQITDVCIRVEEGSEGWVEIADSRTASFGVALCWIGRRIAEDEAAARREAQSWEMYHDERRASDPDRERFCAD